MPRRTPLPAPRPGALACLLCGAVLALALAACAPSVPPPTTDANPRPVVDDASSLRRVPVLTTLSSVLDTGRQSFEAGRYAVAGARFEAVLAHEPHEPVATIYLGLCHWFAGHPEKTTALWTAYPDDDPPGFAAALRAEAASLAMLADRLRARGLVRSALQGGQEPLAPGLAVLARPRLESPALPGVGRALQWLLHEAVAGPVSGLDAPRPAPYGLLRAVTREAGLDHPRGDDAETALLLAQLIGAQYAVSCTLAPVPGAPGLVRTRVTAQSAEDPGQRLLRLGAAAEEAARAAADARKALADLDQDLALTAFGLRYYEAEERMNTLLAERKALETQILALNRARALRAATETVERLERQKRTFAAAQQELRDLEQATVGLAAHVFAHNPESLAKRDAELRDSRSGLEAKATELAQRADIARAEVLRRWPPEGLSVDFTLPEAELTRWPALARRAVGSLLGGRPLPGALAPAFGPDAGPDALSALDRALAAREAGDQASAREQFALARPLAPRPPELPAPDFDLAAQADMAPEAIAALYVRRLTRALDAARSGGRTP